jgi:uncharacterized protein YukJ
MHHVLMGSGRTAKKSRKEYGSFWDGGKILASRK